jgi:hypothetical protein
MHDASASSSKRLRNAPLRNAVTMLPIDTFRDTGQKGTRSGCFLDAPRSSCVGGFWHVPWCQHQKAQHSTRTVLPRARWAATATRAIAFPTPAKRRGFVQAHGLWLPKHAPKYITSMCFFKGRIVFGLTIRRFAHKDRDTGATTQRIRAISAIGRGTLYMNRPIQLKHLRPVYQGLRLASALHSLVRGVRIQLQLYYRV